MSARSVMTMLARILRNTQTNKDPYGHRSPLAEEIVGTVPCRVWYAMGYLAIRDKSTVSARDLKMIVPLDSDIKVNDLVDSVWDRQDKELFSKLKVEAPLRRANHIECRLQENA